jgi:phenylacetate-CoA ligase
MTPRRALDSLQQFVRTSLGPEPNQDIDAVAEAAVLQLFTTAATTVPAYAAFLSEHGVDPRGVRTMDDFRLLPLVTRQGYMRRFPLPQRCRGGDLAACDMMAVSSGSTGEATFWPRTLADECAVASRFELVFGDAFEADHKRTLAVVCFPLGTWVGGMFTASCCRHLASKGYRVTTVTPGNQRAEIFRVVNALGPMFGQTVLLGYPPFVKDVIDAGLAECVPWASLRVKLVLAGEVFSESWRELVSERAGMTRILFDSASLYGTADAGVLGCETPVSIAIRRFLADRVDATRALFRQSRLPTLVQFDPRERFLEEHEGTLVVSADTALPLVRYHIADDGGVIPYRQMMTRLRDLGFDAEAEARAAGARAIRSLPFAYVFGRSHFAVSFYGANVFPEVVSMALERAELRAQFTGKFVMQVREDDERDRHLFIAIELAPAVAESPGLRDAVTAAAMDVLVERSSEYANYVPLQRRRPTVTLLPSGDPEYFPVGVKHRYSRP